MRYTHRACPIENSVIRTSQGDFFHIAYLLSHPPRQYYFTQSCTCSLSSHMINVVLHNYYDTDSSDWLYLHSCIYYSHPTRDINAIIITPRAQATKGLCDRSWCPCIYICKKKFEKIWLLYHDSNKRRVFYKFPVQLDSSRSHPGLHKSCMFLLCDINHTPKAIIT